MEIASLSLACFLLLKIFSPNFIQTLRASKARLQQSMRNGKEKYQSENLGKHTANDGRGIQGEREKILQKRDRWYQSFSSPLYCRKIKKWTWVSKKEKKFKIK